MYVEEDGPSTKKLYIHVAAEHEGSYTCSGVLEGNLQSKTVRLELFSEFAFTGQKVTLYAFTSVVVECVICACKYSVFRVTCWCFPCVEQRTSHTIQRRVRSIQLSMRMD